MLPVYIHQLGASEALLGLVVGITALATVVARPIAGLLVEQYGRRGVLFVGLIGMIATSISFTFLPLIGVILTIRFIQGLFWGLNNTAIATVASDNIPKARFAEGMGWYSQGSSLAQILTPAVSLAAFYQIGAHISLTMSAGFFTLAFIASLFVTYRRVDKTAQAPIRLQISSQGGIHGFIRNTLLERRAYFAMAMIFFTSVSFGVVNSFLPTLAAERDITGVEWFFVVSAVLSLAGRPLFGIWADRRGYKEPAIVGFMLMAVGLGMLVFVDSTTMLLISAIGQGLGYSTCFSLFLALASHDASPSRRGAAIATVMIGFDIGSGGSAVLLGVIAGFAGLTPIFAIAAVLPVVAAVIYLLRKDPEKVVARQIGVEAIEVHAAADDS